MIHNKLGKPNSALVFSITFMLTFLSCSSSGKNTRATNRHGKGSCGMIEITYDFAEVGLRTSGETWDTESKKENGLDKLLLGGLLLAMSVPATFALEAAALFTENAPSDGSVTEPDLIVTIIGEKHGFTSPKKMNQSNAYWNYKAVIDTDLLEQKVKLLVLDADPEGAETVGIQYIDKKQLCKPGMHEFKNFGQVKQLVLKTAPYVRKPVKKTLRVAADQHITSTKVQVLQGMEIDISAKGVVCANSSRCTGPEGFPLPEWRSYNYLKDENHCSLLLYILPENETRRSALKGPFHIGKGKRFKAPYTGVIFLGPNDDDEDNNRGEYEVTLELR